MKALLTPTTTTRTVSLAGKKGRLFRKQILPKGKINYNGRQINFDEQYLLDLTNAFKSQAFPQVAFQLADSDNKHTLDPERFRGEVRGVELAEDGLYGILELTEEGAEVVRKNPRLGVSARIIEGLEHADGRSYPRAMQHVLGTLDPRVTNQKPWEEISLSQEVEETIDLTQGTYEVSGGSLFTPEEQEFIDRSVAEILAEYPNTQEDPPKEEEQEMPNTGTEEPTIDADAPTGDETVETTTGNVDLAREAERDAQLERMAQELADSRFETEQQRLIEQGVPPAMIDLARPVLTMPQSAVVELSRTDDEGNNVTVDFQKVVRDLLNEAKGTIDLNREDGFTDDDDITDEDKVLELWKD